MTSDDPPPTSGTPWERPANDDDVVEAGATAVDPAAEAHAGSNLRSPSPSEAWEADVGLLREWHARLLDAVAAFDPERLDQPATSEHTYFDLVSGGSAHDAYHAGQIRLVERMRRDGSLRSPVRPRR